MSSSFNSIFLIVLSDFDEMCSNGDTPHFTKSPFRGLVFTNLMFEKHFTFITFYYFYMARIRTTVLLVTHQQLNCISFKVDQSHPISQDNDLDDSDPEKHT
jgi:hypothetical protein